jgi:hypothetical protein
MGGCHVAGHGGVSVDTIDDLLDRVKSAYMRLIESTPDDVHAVAASTDESDLLVPLVPDCQEVLVSLCSDGVKFLLCSMPIRRTVMLQRSSSRPTLPPRSREDGVLSLPDPRRSSPDSTLSDQSNLRVDDSGEDAASAERVGREGWMEWAKMDVGELLGDLEDEEDLTDQHWKRSADDQPTVSSAGHQDSRDEQYQATEPSRPGTTPSSHLVCTFCAAIS